MNQRPIEFRALSLEGNIIKDIGSIEFFADGRITVNDEIPVERLIQFTGLFDKHGKKIFEGDIVKHASYYGGWHNSQVGYGSGYWYPLVNVEESHDCIDRYHPEDYEVIGNIYEHPQLLKEI